MVPFYRFTMKAGAPKVAVLTIYDEIGAWGVSAAGFRAGLESVKDADEIDLEINSYGGDVFAGIAIYNMLRASGKKINAKVMGIAASAASLILMAGDTRTIPENGMVMVHNPMALAMGNADEMRETADMLDQIGNGVRATYAKVTGMSDEDLAAMLAKDTWLSANESLEHGFVTEVTSSIEATASFDLEATTLPAAVKAIYASAKKPVLNGGKTPEQIAAEANSQAGEKQPVVTDPPKTDPTEAERQQAAADLELGMPVATATHELAMKAGLTDHADYLAVAAASLDEGRTMVARAGEIVALAKFAKRPDAEIKALVRGGKTVAECRTAIMAAMAEEDVHTSTTKPAPVVNASSQAGVKPAGDAYRKRADARQARRAK